MRGIAPGSDVLEERGVTSKVIVPNDNAAETDQRAIGIEANGFAQDAYGAQRTWDLYCNPKTWSLW